MKNKNKMLFASTTAVAVLLSACSFTEVSVQEKFSNDISKLASAETIQGTIDTSYIVDEKMLKEKKFTQEEINDLKKVLDTTNFTIDYKADKKQAELIIKGEMKEEELGVQFDLEIPMIIDLENNKFYGNLDSFMIGFSNAILDLSKKAALDAGEFSEEEINEEIESMKKNLEELDSKGKFMDLEDLMDEEDSSSGLDILDAFEINQYHVINKSEETIKALVEFIKTLDVATFEENKDKNGYSLKLDAEKSTALNEITNMFPKENLKTDESDEDSYDDIYTKDEILVDYMSNDYFEKMGESKISYKLKDDKLNEVVLENDFIIDGYTYTQKSHYKNLKINEPIEFKYNLSEIEVLKKEESEELMGGFVMTIFMFAMMQMASGDMGEDSMIDFDFDFDMEDEEDYEDTDEFDWDNWDNWDK